MVDLFLTEESADVKDWSRYDNTKGKGLKYAGPEIESPEMALKANMLECSTRSTRVDRGLARKSSVSARVTNRVTHKPIKTLDS